MRYLNVLISRWRKRRKMVSSSRTVAGSRTCGAPQKVSIVGIARRLASAKSFHEIRSQSHSYRAHSSFIYLQIR